MICLGCAIRRAPQPLAENIQSRDAVGFGQRGKLKMVSTNESIVVPCRSAICPT